MCAVLNISPKTYYKYRNLEDPDYYDYLIIKEIFQLKQLELGNLKEFFIQKIILGKDKNVVDQKNQI